MGTAVKEERATWNENYVYDINESLGDESISSLIIY